MKIHVVFKQPVFRKLILAALVTLGASGASGANLTDIKPGPHDWPWWSGVNGNNISPETQSPPTQWSTTKNVLWKTEVPGRGHGSPTVWGERIFLATADEAAKTQSLLCFDRATGKPLWQTQVHQGEFMPMHKKNTHASATPACDGQHVFITFIAQGGIWLTCLDFAGKITWQKRLGDFHPVHGFAASPVFYKDLVIVPADQTQNSFIIAVKRATGDVVWRADKPSFGFGSFATPTVARMAGRDQLLLQGAYKVFSYDPATGKLLWTCDGPANQCISNILVDDQYVYACAGYPQRNLLCIRPDGNGDVTRTHIVWRKDGGSSYVVTPLLADGLLYMVHDESGKITCFTAKTGEVIWQGNVKGKYSSSPVLAGGYIYLVNEQGLTSVLKPGKKFERVAENDLGDGGFALPVVCGGRIYLRTLHSLYCLGAQ